MGELYIFYGQPKNRKGQRKVLLSTRGYKKYGIDGVMVVKLEKKY
jgi:hypothetical protein